MPLTPTTKEIIEAAVAAVEREGYTFCGVAIKNDESEVQPFSNLGTTAEFVFNMLSGAGMVADTIGANVDPIVTAQLSFQKQFIKINEA